MDMHSSITTDRILDAVQESSFDLSMPGICIACGEDADTVEPDAENYECEHCGESQVFGVERILVEMG